MTLLISRRQVVAGVLLAIPPIVSAQSPAQGQTDAQSGLGDLERTHGGRLGVAMLNLATGARAGHRTGERFLMCSTFKTLLAGLILARVDQGHEALDRRIIFSEADLVTWSPVTETRVGGTGMTVAELCEATVTESDNAAANLLLASFGGPAELTAFVRTLGDEVTRLDRIEPDLNEHDGPGDLRDTTTPEAMLETLRKLIYDDVLSKASRSQLAAWHLINKSGDSRLRAGFPGHWLVGDKTGTNRSGNANDIGIAWPPDRGAVIVTVYCEMPAASAATRDAVIAEVARIAAEL